MSVLSVQMYWKPYSADMAAANSRAWARWRGSTPSKMVLSWIRKSMPRPRRRAKEMVGCSVEFAGLFDSQGRLRCYGALYQRGDGECAVPHWKVCRVVSSEGQEAQP